jgi:hypothetical protein
MSQQHIVAVLLEEHVPEGIELPTARFRFVSGEDAVYSAERGFVLVLPKTCDNEEHNITPWCLSASHICKLVKNAPDEGSSGSLPQRRRPSGKYK